MNPLPVSENSRLNFHSLKSPEHNLTLQDSLYALRGETKQAFDEAKALEARWKEIEREQKEVYQVRGFTQTCSENILTKAYPESDSQLHSFS